MLIPFCLKKLCNEGTKQKHRRHKNQEKENSTEQYVKLSPKTPDWSEGLGGSEGPVTDFENLKNWSKIPKEADWYQTEQLNTRESDRAEWE